MMVVLVVMTTHDNVPHDGNTEERRSIPVNTTIMKMTRWLPTPLGASPCGFESCHQHPRYAALGTPSLYSARVRGHRGGQFAALIERPGQPPRPFAFCMPSRPLPA